MNKLGYSLWEFCIALCIIAIMLGMAIPAFTQFLMQQERSLILNQLKTAIEFAKQEAHLRHTTITLCASQNGKTCLFNDWSNGFMVLVEPTEVLQIFPGLHYGRLHFAQFGQHLHIQQDSSTINIGTFTYCPKNRDRREAEALVINKVGRVYSPNARNTLGIRLKNAGTSNPTPLICQ